MLKFCLGKILDTLAWKLQKFQISWSYLQDVHTGLRKWCVYIYIYIYNQNEEINIENVVPAKLVPKIINK